MVFTSSPLVSSVIFTSSPIVSSVVFTSSPLVSSVVFSKDQDDDGGVVQYGEVEVGEFFVESIKFNVLGKNIFFG